MQAKPDPSQDFQELASDPHNAHILTTIHSSAFVLCLDTESSTGLAAVSRQLWHGAVTPPSPSATDSGADALPTLGLRNRWMDKPCQFVVLPDGTAGFVGEHSVMDGTPTATMCDRVLDLIVLPAFASSTNSSLYANRLARSPCLSTKPSAQRRRPRSRSSALRRPTPWARRTVRPR